MQLAALPRCWRVVQACAASTFIHYVVARGLHGMQDVMWKQKPA